MKIRICHITCTVINHRIGIINIASKTFSILQKEIKMKDLKGSIKLLAANKTKPYLTIETKSDTKMFDMYIYIYIYIC